MALIAVEYVKTPAGLVNILAILVNLADLIACGLRWSKEGDIYIQLIFADHGWQTLVMLFLFCTFILLVGLLLFRLSAGKETSARLTKGGTIFLLLVALILCILATAIDIWYVTVDDKSNRKMFNRIIAVMILSIILSLLIILLIILVGLYYEQFYRVTDIHAASGPHANIPRPSTNAFFHTTTSSGHVPQAPPTYQSSANSYPSQPIKSPTTVHSPVANTNPVIPRVDGNNRPRNLVLASELVPDSEKEEARREVMRLDSVREDPAELIAHESDHTIEERAESREQHLIDLERRLSPQLEHVEHEIHHRAQTS